MKHLSKKVPVMKDGLERDIETYVLEQIHGRSGLTRHLQTNAGVNGKHLKMENPVDMNLSRWLRIMLWKAQWQGEEGFTTDMACLTKKIIKLAKKL